MKIRKSSPGKLTIGILIIGIFSLLLIYSAVHVFNIVLQKFSVKLESILPEKIKTWLKIIFELFGFFVPILCGMAIYHLWDKDKYTAIFWLGFLLVLKLFELTNKEREKKSSDNTN